MSLDRPIILFNNAGVASSSGDTPDTVSAMGDHVVAFINALELPPVDLLGFSLGGFVAQDVTHRYPELVRKLILVGTGPRQGEVTQDRKMLEIAGGDNSSIDSFLYLFFAPSVTSQAAGRAWWERRHLREDQDPPSSPETAQAQVAALIEWHQPQGERYEYLASIQQPTLIVNGHTDVMVPTVNSFTMSQHIPNAQLIIYPDSGHGAHFQYPELFVEHTRLFLDSFDGSA